MPPHSVFRNLESAARTSLPGMLMAGRVSQPPWRMSTAARDPFEPVVVAEEGSDVRVITESVDHSSDADVIAGT